MKTYSNKSFKYGIIAVFLILSSIGLIIATFTFSDSIFSLISGGLIFIASILGILGLEKSIKGIKEPNTIKKIVGLVLNSVIVALTLLIIAANIYDILKALS